MRFRMIDRCRDAYPVAMMCRLLKVSSTGFYDWKGRGPSAREKENRLLLSRIRELHAGSDGVMGAPRIRDELRYQGVACSENRVARLMKLDGLRGIPQKRQWHKKTSGERPAGIKNHRQRDFQSGDENSKRVTDITYIRTGDGWLYLCVVIDLYSGIVVGWSMSHRQTRDLVIQAVLMALWQRSNQSPVILHSDRGCQGGFNWSSQHISSMEVFYGTTRRMDARVNWSASNALTRRAIAPL